jgi:hypothetical protein
MTLRGWKNVVNFFSSGSFSIISPEELMRFQAENNKKCCSSDHCHDHAGGRRGAGGTAAAGGGGGGGAVGGRSAASSSLAGMGLGLGLGQGSVGTPFALAPAPGAVDGRQQQQDLDFFSLAEVAHGAPKQQKKPASDAASGFNVYD